MSTILQSFDIWSKLERWKSLVSRCFMSWLQIKKIVLKCHLLLLTRATISQSNCDILRKVDFIWQLVIISSLVGLKRNSKALSQSETCTKKSSSLLGGLLLVWSTTAFIILVKPLHMRSLVKKLMRCTEKCNICSEHWSIEWAKFFPMTMRDHM